MIKRRMRAKGIYDSRGKVQPTVTCRDKLRRRRIQHDKYQQAAAYIKQLTDMSAPA